MKLFILSAAIFLGACGAGPQFNTGSQGPQGMPGTNGTDGTNATPVTVVQFCPGVTPVYPTTFPEDGLCTNGSIYAVYSANDGFLTEIVPGIYSSNAVGSTCTFTLSANCIVSN